MSLESISTSSGNETDELTFHNACAKGNLSVVKVYLGQQEFDMNIRDNRGATGFHVACRNRKLNVVIFLLDQGFDMNIGDNKGCTGFHSACYHGQLNVVLFLLDQGFDMNIGDNKGLTGFHWACCKRSLNGLNAVVVLFLLSKRFYMNVGGREFLHSFLARYGCSKESLNKVQFLLQERFDMNVGDNEGRTGFHLACSVGNLNVVELFLQEGFDMNVGDDNERTGFHNACIGGKLNVVQFLLQEGFDMNICDNEGITGFNNACFFGKLNIVQFLLEQGFNDIYELDVGLEMLFHEDLHLSDREDFIPCIVLLIESGAQLDESYVFEELICAMQNRIIEITVVKKTIFENWTGRIAQAITDFTMGIITSTSSQNLSQFLDSHTVQTTHGWCSFL